MRAPSLEPQTAMRYLIATIVVIALATGVLLGGVVRESRAVEPVPSTSPIQAESLRSEFGSRDTGALLRRLQDEARARPDSAQTNALLGLAYAQAGAHAGYVGGARCERPPLDETARVASWLEAEAVVRCLGTLTDTQQESVRLAYYGGLTYREVAEKLNAAVPTIRSRIRDGLIRLKTCLGVS